MMGNMRALILLILAVHGNFCVHATVQFSNNSAAFVLTSANASIKLNPTEVSGWNGRSIIKQITGAGLGDYNIKSYGDANSIVMYAEAPAELMYSNSNAIGLLSRGVMANSNAILQANASVNENARTTSNAISWLDEQLDTLDHGPFDVAVNISNFELSNDIYLSNNHAMSVTINTEIDGDGNAILFARNPGAPILTIGAGLTARFKNILMWEFPEGPPALSLGSDARLIFGPNTTVEIGENSIITTTWYFDGVSILNGRGKILQLGTGGSIVLRPGSSLLFDNITLKGIRTGKIFCMDNSCTISFGSVMWTQNADYTFTQGRFDVVSGWELIGTSTFGYQSNRQSMIKSDGQMTLSSGMSFSYAPPTDNRDLLAMEGMDARLHFDNASLISTTTGMRLTNGTLLIDGASTLLNNAAASVSEAISIGNGVEADELSIVIGAGAQLELLTGILFYDQEE